MHSKLVVKLLQFVAGEREQQPLVRVIEVGQNLAIRVFRKEFTPPKM